MREGWLVAGNCMKKDGKTVSKPFLPEQKLELN